ncbi:CHC2 zinc finger domain-containing protein [Pantoea sp. UYEF8]|uniref:CHC2 zinc finger domain-containing protein n=1 Tax=Pantoea sp. UYEF8 TaxID=1756394 RepID=UPI003392DDA6
MSIIDSAMKLTELTKQGANYRGLCPFHEENTPSFVVRPQSNDFICFGCGKSGGEIELAQFERDSRQQPGKGQKRGGF